MDITCYVAALKSSLTSLPALPLVCARNVSVEDLFLEGSITDAGEPAIRLRFDSNRLHNGHVDEGDTSVDRISECFNKIVGEPTRYKNGVNEIALIFADQLWGEDNVLGMMFDLGFDPGPGTNPVSQGRRGAVIFLSTIAKLRTGQDLPAAAMDPSYLHEVAFSAGHELGHVFNLWHSGPGVPGHTLSLMTSSDLTAGYGSDACHFDGKKQYNPDGLNYLSHTKFLADCDDHAEVQPGGTRFGNRGPLGPRETESLNRARADPHIQLQIFAARHEFWRFEPVQLDLALSLHQKSRQSTAFVPDELDPAFQRFDLWITNPDDTRTVYRSPVQFCRSLAPRRRMEKHRPFRRDIPIFGQAGGYTFNQAGEHKLCAVFRVGRRLIASNEVKVNVLPAQRTPEYMRLRDALKQHDVAKLMFYGSGRDPETVNDRLKPLVQRFARHAATGDVRYGLGRALLAECERLAANDRVGSQRLAIAAREHLAAAADRKTLGPLRRQRASESRDRAAQFARLSFSSIKH
jgi:hypothetical protein